MALEVLFGEAFVVVDEEEAQGLNVGKKLFGEGEGFTNETRHTLAQGEIEAFDVVGFSLPFGARAMLLLGHNTLVTGIKVGVTRACFVGVWNLGPQTVATERIPFAVPPRHHLTRAPRKSNPDPHSILLMAHKRPHLIQFQRLVFLGGQQRAVQVIYTALSLFVEQLLGVFFWIAATVTREIFNARLIPR